MSNHTIDILEELASIAAAQFAPLAPGNMSGAGEGEKTALYLYKEITARIEAERQPPAPPPHTPAIEALERIASKTAIAHGVISAIYGLGAAEQELYKIYTQIREEIATQRRQVEETAMSSQELAHAISEIAEYIRDSDATRPGEPTELRIASEDGQIVASLIWYHHDGMIEEHETRSSTAAGAIIAMHRDYIATSSSRRQQRGGVLTCRSNDEHMIAPYSTPIGLETGPKNTEE